MSTGLVIIDVQNWFFRTESRQTKLPRLLSGINRLTSAFTAAGQPVVIVRTIFNPDKSDWDQVMKATNYAVLIQSTLQAEDVEGLVIPKKAARILKTHRSAFIHTDFENILRKMNIDSIVLAGTFVDGCVGLSAIDAWQRYFRVAIAQDAVVYTEEVQGGVMLRFLDVEFGIKALKHEEIIDKLSYKG